MQIMKDINFIQGYSLWIYNTTYICTSALKLIFFGQVDDATGGRAKQVSVGCLSFSDNDVGDSNIGDGESKKSAKVRI